MKLVNLKHVLPLSAALALAAIGAQASYAQTAAQDTTSSAASSSATVSSDTAASPAAPALAAPKPASAASSTAPASGAAVAKLNDVPPPPAGKGQVVFFRPERLAGWAVSFSVREGDKGVAKLTNGTYYVQVTDPGVHEYNVSFETRDNLRLEVEEGETYYVLQAIGMGIVAARPNMTPSTEDAFQEKQLKPTKAKPTDRTAN